MSFNSLSCSLSFSLLTVTFEGSAEAQISQLPTLPFRFISKSNSSLLFMSYVVQAKGHEIRDGK